MMFGPEIIKILPDGVSSLLRLRFGALRTSGTLAALPACLISFGLFAYSAVAYTGTNPFLSEERHNDVRLNDWLSYDNRVDLADGSQLHQYVAEVSPLLEESSPENPFQFHSSL